MKEQKILFPLFLYTKSGISQDLLNVKPLNYCEMAKAGYSFSENKLNSKDVWLTVDENGRQTTPYMKYNKDKVNYLVHYYLDRGGIWRHILSKMIVRKPKQRISI